MKVHFAGKLILLQILAGFYVAVIISVGLWPDPSKSIQSKVLLDFRNYDWYDFAINTAGFIPLGYLFMVSFGSSKGKQGVSILKRAILFAGVGSLISLFIEISQYYLIFGRVSSLFDWFSNTLGTLLGIVSYLVLSKGTGLPKKNKVTIYE
jgi:glycopeptide antibiotics resistance protein